MYDLIKELLKSIWNDIEKVWVKVVNFFKNILGWFQDTERLKKLQENNNLIAIAIKEKMANGEYNVINCLFDENTNTIENEETKVIQSKNIDKETKDKFGNKDLIILS